MKRTWREAATLIVIARDVSKNLKFDYKVLTFKRTDKTSFMPNSVCFPGGAIDKTDEVKDWSSFYENHKISLDDIRRKPGTTKPFIYDHREGLVDREISLRITAVRETFEELGVVICKDPNEPSDSLFSSFYHTKSCNVPVWQKKIHSHEESLMGFCDKFKIVPDIMKIYDWSCWLTPTFFRPKRYETAFFLVALNDIPPVYPEAHEVQEFQWNSPDELLELFRQKKIWLPPPQHVEIRRLSMIKSIDELLKIARTRNDANMTTILPIQFRVQDGFVHVLPGDDLYPENPNFYESSHDLDQFAEKTIEEMRKSAKKLYRSEQRDMYDVKLITNIKPLDGHIEVASDPISKL